MKDINIQIKARNAHLLRAIRKTHGNVNAFCKEFGLHATEIGKLVNFKESPFLKSGGLSVSAENLCSILGKMPGELWPGDVAKIKMKRATAEIEMSQAEVMAICDDSEDRVIQRELIAKWAARLTPREIECVEIRQSGGTLQDAGDALGVTRGRASQIEEKAYRKIRTAAKRDGVTSFAEVAQ